LDEENGMYYYSARYYAPPTFISRDPLFEKYPSISPYTYCANNPMKFVDPTGREKIPWLNRKESRNKNLLNGYGAYKDDNKSIINIFAHGNGDSGWENGLYAGSNGEFPLYHVETFEKKLQASSKEWKNKSEESQLTIIFHVCQVDKDGVDKKGNVDPSFAKRLSSSKDFYNVVIVATEGNAQYGTENETGNFAEQTSGEPWNVYYKGNLIGTYDSNESMEGKNPRQDFKEQISKIDNNETTE